MRNPVILYWKQSAGSYHPFPAVKKENCVNGVVLGALIRSLVCYFFVSTDEGIKEKRGNGKVQENLVKRIEDSQVTETY